jgi:hypothetical protein
MHECPLRVQLEGRRLLFLLNKKGELAVCAVYTLATLSFFSITRHWPLLRVSMQKSCDTLLT